MRPLPIEGGTRVLGEEQGYIPLPVRDVTLIHPDTGEPWAHAIEMVFEPTKEDIGAIVLGEPIRLRLLCVTPPPLMVGVGSKGFIGDRE